MRIFRRIAIPLLLFVFLAPAIIFANLGQKEKETLIKELPKDLAELNKLVIQFREQLEKMTPEERKQWCKDMQEKTEKSPPPIPIQFNCS